MIDARTLRLGDMVLDKETGLILKVVGLYIFDHKAFEERGYAELTLAIDDETYYDEWYSDTDKVDPLNEELTGAIACNGSNIHNQ